MRAHRLFAISLLVACGDDGNVKPDAGPRIDAPVNTVDAAVDGAPDIDAPPDAPVTPPGGSRVYAVGDIQTDNVRIVAGFDDDATLPIDPMAPPIKIPAMGTELFDGAGSTQFVFDVRNGRTVYVADSTVAGRFDLYAADASGGSPLLLVTGQMGIEITSVAVSPDGTKVAFTMDSLLVNGGYDLYMVSTTNPQTPVRLSPDRPIGNLDATIDVFTQYTWSSDSKYLSFSADLTESGYDQAYVVDTTAATPAAVSLLNRDEIATQMMGAQGVRGNILFDSENNLYFRARIQTGSAQFQLFKATVAGAASRTVLALPARGDQSVPDVGAFGITPDGTKIVFSADAPTAGRYDFYASATATFTPTAITSLGAVGHSVFTLPLWFSPDGSKFAVVADFLTSGLASPRNEPFVIAVDGSTMTPRRLVSVEASCAASATKNCDASVVQWSADNTTVWIQGDLTTDNDVELYKASSEMADQTPTLALDLVVGGDLVNLITRPL